MFASNVNSTTTQHYQDLNSSFNSQCSEYSQESCDTNYHIYNELQMQDASNAIPIQTNSNPPMPYGFRTRHLSCIEENDSDSLHSSSLPPPYDMMRQVDEDFKCHHSMAVAGDNVGNTSINSWPDDENYQNDDNADEIIMIDETRLYDLEYFDELSISKTEQAHQQVQTSQEEYWQSTVSEPLQRINYAGRGGMPPDIMTTSCYGALNTTFGSDTSSTAPPAYIEMHSTPIKQQHRPGPEPLYATPEKRREFNRSFDSSGQSASSSIYGGMEMNYAGSMTSSLDLKYMTTSALHGNSTPLDLSADGMKLIDWHSTTDVGAAATKEELAIVGGSSSCGPDELNAEMATQCLNAAEQDLQSIRRLLEHETSGSVCPSCRISFDKGKRRKLIDTCGHERCYSCMFRNDQCPMCMNHSLKDVDCNNAQGYDTGIGGSTSTIVSPLGSPQPQLRSQVQRANAAALAKYMQHHRQESISPEYRYASIGKPPKATVAAAAHTHTVTVDVHHSNNNNNSNGNSNNIGSKNNNSTYSEINAAAFATPPTRRRFFNHQKLRSALTGHRRTASNGGCPIDTASIFSGGKEHNNPLETSTCSDSVVTRRRRKNVNNSVASTTTTGSENRLNRLSLAGTTVYAGHLSSLVFGKIKSLWNVNATSSNAGLNQLAGNDILTTDHPGPSSNDKQKDQLRARLGLLLDSDQNSSTTNTSSSSTNISPEQTLSNGCSNVLSPVENFGSQLSVAIKDDTISLAGKLKACTLNDSSNGGYECFPVKARKAPARRSARTGQLIGASKRNGIYKASNLQVQQPVVQLALKPLFFEVPLQEPDPPFIGRQWLLRELSNILTGTETPGVLINGHPGTGKTALVLQLVEYSCFGRRKDATSTTESDGIYCQINIGHDRLRALASHIVGYHFCQADSNLTCLVPDFVHSLAAQLCQAPQLTAYREYLINEPHLQDILSVKECIADAERVMRMAILEPLAALKRSNKITAKTCVILVDALCEAEYHRPDHGHTIATFLAKMTQFFPSWLKVVATVRTQMLEFVKGLSYTKMTLDSWQSNDLLQKDMLDYITFRVNHSADIQHNIAGANVKDNSTGQLKFVGHLQSLTKGSMLYAKLILDLIERGQLVIKSTSYKVLPVSLAQIFLLHFNLRFPTACSFERASPILNVCMAALYPLTLNEIYYTICALKTADEVMTWDEFLQRFQLLDGFLIKRIDNTYMFFHPSFREWLIRRDEGESPKFLCDFREGHAAIAFRLSRLQAPLDAEQTLELGHHMLKAHIYRNCQGPQSPRDMQSFWISSVTDNISAALGSLRNVYNPNLKVSRLMLLAGACPHYQTDFMGDATILCIAAHEGIVPMVSLLLEFGADVGRTNSQGCTPLILAAMRGHCDVVRLLVAAGSSLGQTDTTQRCALVHAARMGRLNVVKYLLACDWTPRAQTDVALSCALQQALIGAAAQDHMTILEDLLEMDDVDVNEVESASGDMALTAAARNGCVDAVVVLLTQGARVDARNKHGFTALSLAVKEGHWAVVEKLLQSGADIDAFVLPTRKTSLMIAAEEGHLDLLEMLVQRGADLEAQDHEGFTALSWACLRGRQAAAKCLIEQGCNKQHADNNGRTALDLAAYQGSASLVQYLLDQGANLEHIDVNGMRPLDRSIACRNIQVVQVFLRRGAKLGPTTWSMAMGKPEILVVLLNKLLEDGNVLYRKNRFQEAAHRYQYALRKISNLENLLERSAVFAQLRANLLLNLSRCKRKLNELEESIDLASQAIEQKPSSYEGFYARAKARMENGQLNEALVDANEAMQKAAKSGVLPEVVEILKRIQAELLSRITNGNEQDSAKFDYYAAVEGATAVNGGGGEMTDL